MYCASSQSCSRKGVSIYSRGSIERAGGFGVSLCLPPIPHSVPGLSQAAQYSTLSTVHSNLLSINRKCLSRKQCRHEALHPPAPSPPSVSHPSPSASPNSNCDIRKCREEALRDASPLQRCFTSSAFITLPSLSPLLHKCLYVRATFTIHSLGRQVTDVKGGGI